MDRECARISDSYRLNIVTSNNFAKPDFVAEATERYNWTQRIIYNDILK